MTTEKQQKLISLLLNPEFSKNPREALREAGYSDGSEISDVLEGIKDKLLKIADNHLLLHVIGCVEAIVDVRNTPDQKGAKAKLEAAFGMLDRVGLVKKDKIELDVKAASGVLILPSKKET